MLKIDSCTIGGIDKKGIEKILVERGALNPDKFQVTVGCTFGYRIKEAQPKLRQAMEEIVTVVK